MRNLLTAVICCVLLLVAAACNTTGCTENRSSIPLAQFCSASTGFAVTLDSLAIHGVGAPGDSLLLGPGTAANQVYLPLRPDIPSVSFCIAYRYAALDTALLNDTVTLQYSSRPWFADSECGAMYRFEISGCTYTRHILDSVAVVDGEVTNVERPNIQLFFRIAGEDNDR